VLDTEEKPALRIEALPLREQPGFLSLLRQWPRALRNQQNLRLYRPRQASRWRAYAFLFIGLLPTWLTGVYLAAFATDRYMSVTSFVVRTASRPTGPTGFGSLLQMVGFSRSDDDVFSVQDFLRSREAVDRLGKQLQLREIFSHSGRDFVMAFPSFRYGDTNEEFYEYVQNFVDVVYNDTTGITTLTIQAFRPQDAYQMASVMLALAEGKVNELNARIRDDAVRVADGEVQRSQARLSNAMVQVTAFRNREMMMDPNRSSIILSELIGHLGEDLAETQSLAREKASGSPEDPGLPALRQKAAALQSQIQAERGKIANDSTGLADKLAAYERLTMERDFAQAALTRSLDALDLARAEARRQQLFLERIVSPQLPDYPLRPASLATFFTVLALNLIALMVVWLLRTGVQEHVQYNEQ
jgi:capsular polysaccharide transport system permease protein